MAMDLARVDQVLHFALLTAGEADEPNCRQLGPIHLIKYVYLADLAFAAREAGRTFTGIEWTFYRFGPWSAEVNARVEPASQAIGATALVRQSDYEGQDEWTRWSIRDSQLLTDVARLLPSSIQLSLQSAIRMYGSSTPELLDYVYKTAPMLAAAPHEKLDFSLAVSNKVAVDPNIGNIATGVVSAKRLKKFGEKMQQLQREAAKRHGHSASLVNPVQRPPADDILRVGLNWLDEIAGESLRTGDVTAEFGESVWKSAARKGGNVS
jgi:hypothetical protein